MVRIWQLLVEHSQGQISTLFKKKSFSYPAVSNSCKWFCTDRRFPACAARVMKKRIRFSVYSGTSKDCRMPAKTSILEQGPSRNLMENYFSSTHISGVFASALYIMALPFYIGENQEANHYHNIR